MKVTEKIEKIRARHYKILKFLDSARCRSWIRTDIRNELVGDIKILQDHLDQLEKQLQEEPNDRPTP